MNYWIITDTHLGHGKKMAEYCGRPEGFEQIILNTLLNTVKEDDLLIHLGDVCFGQDAEWHKELITHAPCRKWLTLGNHDSKSISWYLTNGWDFVGRSFSLKLFGKKILFSHEPMKDFGYDINIHGHFHNTDHHATDPRYLSVKNEKQHRVSMEFLGYKPVNLQKIIEDFFKGNYD